MCNDDVLIDLAFQVLRSLVHALLLADTKIVGEHGRCAWTMVIVTRAGAERRQGKYTFGFSSNSQGAHGSSS